MAASGAIASFPLFETIVGLGPSLATRAVSSFDGVRVGGFAILADVPFRASGSMRIATGTLPDGIGPRRLLVPAAGVRALGVGLFAPTPDVWV